MTVAESYPRAYGMMVQLQQLAELEEALVHQRSPESLPQASLSKLWEARLDAAKKEGAVWADLLTVHQLGLHPRAHAPGGHAPFSAWHPQTWMLSSAQACDECDAFWSTVKAAPPSQLDYLQRKMTGLFRGSSDLDAALRALMQHQVETAAARFQYQAD